MTLERSVLINGAVLSHHKLERITHICGESTILDVLSWPDATKNTTPIRSIFTVDYDSGLDESEAYAYFSALPEFEEWIDPINEVLPILTDEQAEQVTNLYPSWAAGVAYAVGDRRKYDGKLYRCVQAHTSQEGWEPPVTPAIWTRTGADPTTIEEWVQPTGAQDAYSLNAKVTYNSKTWISIIDNNIWEPGVYGWEEYVE